ncbi:MAG TPA: peptidylprolyl isomerase [Kofleriaceae bacterium]|nr:peptidylprolyl isomerase [Kofleriaceae bacterium]
MSELLAGSPAADWRAIDPEDTLYMDLPSGRVIMELAPGYAPNHAANIRALAREGYYDGAAIVRAQDNYVVQWSRTEESPRPIRTGHATLPAEFDRARGGAPAFAAIPDSDTYAPEVGFSAGFPAARDRERVWLAHCYGMVGAGRDLAADSGGGAELYVVIGQAPRHLDRNVTVVGRVLQGMELLSVMRRGTGDLGFYETPAERTPILRIRVAADLPEAERVHLEALRTDSATFTALVESRRNRREDWFLHQVGHINLCNVPLAGPRAEVIRGRDGAAQPWQQADRTRAIPTPKQMISHSPGHDSRLFMGSSSADAKRTGATAMPARAGRGGRETRRRTTTGGVPGWTVTGPGGIAALARRDAPS